MRNSINISRTLKEQNKDILSDFCLLGNKFKLRIFYYCAKKNTSRKEELSCSMYVVILFR